MKTFETQPAIGRKLSLSPTGSKNTLSETGACPQAILTRIQPQSVRIMNTQFYGA
jgi:hypothetical protein